MASPKKHTRHTVRNVILCLLVLLLLGAGVVFMQLRSKVNSLQAGATFDFTYQVSATTAQTPVLYSVLEQTNATQGRLYGLYAPGKLLLSFYQLNDGASAEAPFTRVYIDSAETLYDVGQLYTTARKALVDAYPLADALLPSWGLGNYISQTQLASLLGTETGSVAMQDMTGFSLSLRSLEFVSPENALDGYVYFQLKNDSEAANAPTLIIGLPKDSFFADETPLHILLTIPEHGVKAELSGTLTAADTLVVAPESRMKDEDVAALAQIRQTIESILQLLQQAAG